MNRLLAFLDAELLLFGVDLYPSSFMPPGSAHSNGSGGFYVARGDYDDLRSLIDDEASLDAVRAFFEQKHGGEHADPT